MKKPVIGRPVFIHPVTKAEIAIPTEVQIDGREERLTFYKQKSDGWAAGGWYQDSSGREFMVKLEESNPYLEKLLNNLATICVGSEFIAENNFTGLCEFRGKTTSYFATEKIPGYYDISSIGVLPEYTSEKKRHALKFHPAFVFNALITFDDTNEENIGLDESGQAKIIDFGHIPHFLYPEQSESANIPFYLASLIGHRNTKGMQLIRNIYFGDDSFLSPIEKKNWGKTPAPEDVTYYEVLIGSKRIIDKKELVIEEISKAISELEAQDISPLDKAKYLKHLVDFRSAMDERIDYLSKVFGEDIKDLEHKKAAFQKIKWRLHPEFAKLMEKEKEVFDGCTKSDCQKDLTNISKIIGCSEDKDEIIGVMLDGEKKEELKKYVNESLALHNAVMNRDVKMIKWLLNNDLADINKTRTVPKKHNYQYHRLTPLHIAIAIYYDDLTYNPQNSASNHEIIGILKEKFFEKNGDRFEQERAYQGDKFAIMQTFQGYVTYKENSSEVNNEAAKKIQKAFRSHQQSKREELEIKKVEAQEKPRSFVEAAQSGKWGKIKSLSGANEL